jgi:hypothetical protein
MVGLLVAVGSAFAQLTCTRSGNCDHAIHRLSVALEEHEAKLMWLACDPRLDTIRKAPPIYRVPGWSHARPSRGPAGIVSRERPLRHPQLRSLSFSIQQGTIKRETNHSDPA